MSWFATFWASRPRKPRSWSIWDVEGEAYCPTRVHGAPSLTWRIIDVLPWQCHTRYPESCVNARFIDVDYPDLMTKKRDIVLGTPELCNLMGSFEAADGSPILISSARYCQVGCDLRDLQALEQCFTSLVDIASCSFLFVAEVSITYMATPDADALIQWASTIGDGEKTRLTPVRPS